jgi:hypothetical protein
MLSSIHHQENTFQVAVVASLSYQAFPFLCKMKPVGSSCSAPENHMLERSAFLSFIELGVASAND